MFSHEHNCVFTFSKDRLKSRINSFITSSTDNSSQNKDATCPISNSPSFRSPSKIPFLARPLPNNSRNSSTDAPRASASSTAVAKSPFTRRVGDSFFNNNFVSPSLRFKHSFLKFSCAEGFEAGGHNGREETTTLCLIPAVRAATTLPLIAAGGIATGEAMLAARVLGAEGVQIGTRFALTQESSAHEYFKEYCLRLQEGDTRLLLKKLAPVRLVRNNFRDAVEAAEAVGATQDELRILLAHGRAKKGIFYGDLEEGELEIGQASALLYGKQIETVAEVMQELTEGYRRAWDALKE